MTMNNYANWGNFCYPVPKKRSIDYRKIIYNEVEYSESETLSEEVYNYLLSISKRYSQTTK